jgi:UDP-2,3-diacylglucosamine hydrolase
MINIEIKDGAFVLSDAHYSHLRPELLEFFKEIDSKGLNPTQIILLGDMFDALFYEVPYTQEVNFELIELINKISKDIEIIYFEGNHDFNLQKIFPNVKVIPIQNQPFLAKYRDKKVLLAHGDFDGGLGYMVYTKIIRNKFVLYTLSFLDKIFDHFIINKLDDYLAKKDDCKEIISFESLVAKRVENIVECDYFVEGHFHQNKSFFIGGFFYRNVAAFACNQRYFIVKSFNDNELLVEETFSKGYKK